jgi:hypothetical protein
VSRATVRWHDRAIEDLASLWLESADQPKLERSANEIDELLEFNPSSKGQAFALSRLNDQQLSLLLERAVVLPEDLRWSRCGPLEVFFIAREYDCLVLVYLVQLRSEF